jgi:hypothetical protein
MSSYEAGSPVSAYDRESLYARSETPEIVEPEDDLTLHSTVSGGGGGGGVNLADELAAAEDFEDQDREESHLAPSQNRMSVIQSDYEGSEYGDIDDDSDDGYLSDRVDLQEQQLLQLAREYTGDTSRDGTVYNFIEKLRNMRGTIDVENNVRRLVVLFKVANKINYHATLASDFTRLSSPCPSRYTHIVSTATPRRYLPQPPSDITTPSTSANHESLSRFITRSNRIIRYTGHDAPRTTPSHPEIEKCKGLIHGTER